MIRQLFAAAALAAVCACTSAGVKEIETREVVVTVTEKPITAAQARGAAPPAALGPRPADARAAADTLLAKLCEWVGYGEKADPLIQHAAGLSPIARVAEPACKGR